MRSEGAKQIITATAMNPSNSLAFFNRLKICRGASKQLVRPVFYSDNYFSILPGETKTVTIDFDAKELGGEVARSWRKAGISRKWKSVVAAVCDRR